MIKTIPSRNSKVGAGTGKTRTARQPEGNADGYCTLRGVHAPGRPNEASGR
ncbi:hypothetical protein MBBA_0756 [Methanoculleus bourgensis]|jgi:hypothetical protein|nr:hypothetical protein MBBA_0756 [Methanoculleus bourgensis]